jgi:hypothetical protein
MNIHDPGTKVPTYTPLWLSNFDLPKDRTTINAWCRSFYALDPDVHRIINQHASLIAASFTFHKTKSSTANQFCKNQLADLNFPSVIETIVQEYFTLGEAFVYAELDESKGKWSRLIIQNPDFIVIKRSTVNSRSDIMLRPDGDLRRICLSNAPEDCETQKQLNKNIVNAIKNGENIPLDPFYISCFIRKISPYEIRGTSILAPLLHTLKERDPETIKTIKLALYDIEAYDDKTIVKDVLLQRYLQAGNMLQQWINNKLIEPICRIQNLEHVPSVSFSTTKLKRSLGI